MTFITLPTVVTFYNISRIIYRYFGWLVARVLFPYSPHTHTPSTYHYTPTSILLLFVRRMTSRINFLPGSVCRWRMGDLHTWVVNTHARYYTRTYCLPILLPSLSVWWTEPVRSRHFTCVFTRTRFGSARFPLTSRHLRLKAFCNISLPHGRTLNVTFFLHRVFFRLGLPGYV